MIKLCLFNKNNHRKICRKVLIFVPLSRINQMNIDIMKYSELEKLIIATTNSRFHRQGRRHPIWKNHDTGEFFEMSRHKSEEVAKGTLNNILEKSGAKK